MGVLYARVAGAWQPITSSTPTAQDRWYSAWGIVASVSPNLAQTALSTTATTLTSLSVPTVVGRRYAVHAAVRTIEGTGGIPVVIFTCTGIPGDTVFSDHYVRSDTAANGYGGGATVSWRFTGDGTTPTLSLRAATYTGTAFLHGQAGSATQFWVEDVGPVTGTAVPTPTQDRWFNAWGIVAKGAFISAGQISLPANVPTVVTTPLAVATVAGRRYRITFVARAWDLSGVATSTFARVILRVNGTPQPTGDPLKGGIAGLYDLINFQWLVDGDGTSKTFDATITPNQASAVYGEPNTSTFYVEDMGPITGAVVVTPATQDSVWYAAWGIVGVGAIPFGDNTFLTPGAALTNPLVVTTVANRRYRIAFNMRAFANAMSVGNAVNIRVDGVDGAERWQQVIGSNAYTQFNTEWLWTGAAGSHTFLVMWGAATNSYGYGINGHFYIEDMGPVTGGTIPPPQVTITPWTAVTFTNGWTNYGGGYQSCQYRLFGDVVNVRGLMAGGTAAQPAFTLPVGFRPPGRLQIVTQASGAFGWFSVDPSGQVNPEQGVNSAYNVNCSFSITP